jgi:hypothetical protein
MNPLLVIVLFILVLAGCNHPSRHHAQKKDAISFVLNSSDLRVLYDSVCSKEFDINLFQSISEYDSTKKAYFADSNNFGKRICICFNFKDSTTFPSKRICTPIIPRSYNIAAAMVPAHSLLLISLSKSNLIQTVQGNEFYQGNQAVDSLNNYVRKLFLNKPDTSSYGEKFIHLQFADDSVTFADKCLSQLVIGYIKAQRALCQLKFGKPLREASLMEIQALQLAAPLRFKLSKIKNYP